MKSEEISALSNRELRQRIEDARHDLFNFRFQIETRKNKNVSAIRNTRRDIARLQTALRERQLIAEVTGEVFDEGSEEVVTATASELPRRKGLFGLGRRRQG